MRRLLPRFCLTLDLRWQKPQRAGSTVLNLIRWPGDCTERSAGVTRYLSEHNGTWWLNESIHGQSKVAIYADSAISSGKAHSQCPLGGSTCVLMTSSASDALRRVRMLIPCFSAAPSISFTGTGPSPK